MVQKASARQQLAANFVFPRKPLGIASGRRMNCQFHFTRRLSFSPSRVDLFYTVWNDDILQMITAGKRPLFDSGNAAWNRYACQSPAVTKQLLLDLFHSFRQNNFFKTTALVKRAPPDARHALRQADFQKATASLKCTFFDARHPFRKDDVLFSFGASNQLRSRFVLQHTIYGSIMPISFIHMDLFHGPASQKRFLSDRPDVFRQRYML